MKIRKSVRTIHLVLGLTSGLLVVFLGLTGCVLAFQREIENSLQSYRYVTPQQLPYLPPAQIGRIASAELPGKVAHSVTYGRRRDAAVVAFYHDDPEYYYLVYVDPYSGAVLKVKDMDHDFFRIVVNGHFYLWLPPKIGKPVVASATLVFVVMMISGIVLWWPKNKAARQQRFTVKWNARWRRVNYDLHNVLGFYASWVAIFIALTGLVWGFEWVSRSVYWMASGGRQAVAFYEPVSHGDAQPANLPAEDAVLAKMQALYPEAETLEIHFPRNDSAAIEAAANPDASTYWKTDYRYFDRYTLAEIPVRHMYGKLKDATAADKIARMNYDIHVGAIWGLPGKILAFFASLLVASLPVTGFLVWRGRRVKKAFRP